MGIRQCFEFVGDGSDKYWKVASQGSNVDFQWGRTGTSGQSITKEFDSPALAEKAALKKINEKTREGYKQVPC